MSSHQNIVIHFSSCGHLLLLAAVFPEATSDLWLSPVAFFRLPLAVLAACRGRGRGLLPSILDVAPCLGPVFPPAPPAPVSQLLALLVSSVLVFSGVPLNSSSLLTGSVLLGQRPSAPLLDDLSVSGFWMALSGPERELCFCPLPLRGHKKTSCCSQQTPSSSRIFILSSLKIQSQSNNPKKVVGFWVV